MQDAQSDRFTMAELCARHGVSRKTGYKWITRYAEEDTPGRTWWDRVLSTRRSTGGIDAIRMAGAVGVIQYMPYHSATFDHAELRLPSQAASFARAEEALSRGATLIVRGWRYWVSALPALADADQGKVIRLVGRSVGINRFALGDDGYERVEARLKDGAIT